MLSLASLFKCVLVAAGAAARHDILDAWRVGDTVTINADVNYLWQDGSVVTIPCLMLLKWI